MTGLALKVDQRARVRVEAKRGLRIVADEVRRTCEVTGPGVSLRAERDQVRRVESVGRVAAIRVVGRHSTVFPVVVTSPPATVVVNPFTIAATYGVPLAAGQICYVQNGVAYPVTNVMPQAVLYLLAVAPSAGNAGVTRNVIVAGMVSRAGLGLLPGRVFLGDDGFPVSSDDQSAHYVPIGHSDGGDDFYFQPRERYFR